MVTRPMLKRMFAVFPVLLAQCAGALVPAAEAQTNAGPSRWESEIRTFESADKTNPPPPDAVLFVGSSSIRLWKTLAQDFREYHVINRGFGGSEIADSVAFAERIVIPCRPKTIVLYAGDNDLAAGKSPQHVFAGFKAFVQKIQAALPGTRIAFLSIKPSPSRWHLAGEIKTANRMIGDFCRRKKRLIYIDVFHPMLGPDGKPRAELFVEDRLHLNPKGYALWTRIIRSRLQK